MTKDDVIRAYEVWRFHRTRFDCPCVDHHINRWEICEREKAWRSYCKARDAYIGVQKEQGKNINLKDVFDAFDGMN